MRRKIAVYVRELDPRLKLGIALVLGPYLWLMPWGAAFACGLILAVVLVPLADAQPIGRKMVRTLLMFVLFWVAAKGGLDAFWGMPLLQVAADCGVLAVRLASLLLLGLTLSLSTSARALGLAVSWAVAPFAGRERAWKLALSLALMIHFLPMCLETMARVKENVGRRCPDCGFFQRMRLIPQAVIRNLGQKTWNQTLSVAGRGLENADAWIPEFTWSVQDSICAGGCAIILAVILLAG